VATTYEYLLVASTYWWRVLTGGEYLLVVSTYWWRLLTGGVFADKSLFSLSVKPCIKELPPTTITLLYKLCQNYKYNYDNSCIQEIYNKSLYFLVSVNLFRKITVNYTYMYNKPKPASQQMSCIYEVHAYLF
jgi:hypothetical protein